MDWHLPGDATRAGVIDNGEAQVLQVLAYLMLSTCQWFTNDHRRI